MLFWLLITAAAAAVTTTCRNGDFIQIFGDQSTTEWVNINTITHTIPVTKDYIAVGGIATLNGVTSAWVYTFDYTNCLIKSKMSWSSPIASSTLGIHGIGFDVTDNDKLWMLAYEVSGTTVKEYLLTSAYNALASANAFLIETVTGVTNYGLKP